MLCNVQQLILCMWYKYSTSFHTQIHCVFRSTDWLAAANTAIARHEQLLLWLNQSPATYLSANVNVCVCARERVKEYTLRERKITCTVWFLAFYTQYNSTIVQGRITIHTVSIYCIQCSVYTVCVLFYCKEKYTHTHTHKPASLTVF